jgi:hypothetical protein
VLCLSRDLHHSLFVIVAYRYRYVCVPGPRAASSLQSPFARRALNLAVCWIFRARAVIRPRSERSAGQVSLNTAYSTPMRCAAGLKHVPVGVRILIQKQK